VEELTREMKAEASALGFVLAGVTAAATPGRIEAFHRWLDSGRHGQMSYLETRRPAYGHPAHVLEGCTTILMLALPYGTQSPAFPEAGEHPKHTNAPEHMDPRSGRVARYARSPVDYHDVIHDRLRTLKQWLLSRYPEARVRGVVDTAPLLEREFAEMAGIGWVGKNTLLLNRHWGSYFFLAALLTDLPLAIDEPTSQGHCGTCTACLDNCPTGAFPEPFVLDARRCISYLTIEKRDAIAPDLQGSLNGWIFGCDICQEVCPWNRRGRPGDPELSPGFDTLDVVELLALDEETFRQRFRRTPFWRPRRRGMLRNAILIAGSQRIDAALPSLIRLLADEESVLRTAAAWAISQIAPPGWQSLLEATGT
jgi:epoxyqueuosine reductase